MATIREYFEKAFPNAVGVSTMLSAIQDGAEHLEYLIQVRVHIDFDSHASFLSILLPDVPEEKVAAIIAWILETSETFLELRDASEISLPRMYSAAAGTQIRVERADPFVRLTQEAPDRMAIKDRDVVFTGRIYFYSPRELAAETQDSLRSLAHKQGLTVSFRGAKYAAAVDSQIRPKAFISHDWRDKDEIALPIAETLQQMQCPVWYDEYSLRVGNSLRDSIEKGLKETRFCIFIFTPNFLSKGGWPKREYDMAFTREIIEDTRVILPVWHNVTKEEIFEYSPILADRVALRWSGDVEEDCKKLYSAIELGEEDI